MATETHSSSVEPLEEIQSGQEVELQVAGEGPGSLLDAVQAQFGALPWWVISAAVHAIVLLLAILLTVATVQIAPDDQVILTAVQSQPKPEYNEQLKRDLFKRADAPMEKKIDSPMVVQEPVPDDHFETDNNMDKRTARGQEDAISDIPLGGTGAVAIMGVGPGGPAGCFGTRDGGGRKKATARWGGTVGSESAVEAALRWLAKHQEADGHWDCKKYEANKTTDAGCTGLALLAFLGAGYTENEGKYKDNVARATRWIISKQDAAGCIGTGYEGAEKNGVGYHHAICGLALAEAYGMSQSAAIRGPAQKAIDYSVNVHQVPGGGWRYTAKAAEDDPAGTADLSVTGWYVMQLKSAKIAKLTVPASAFQGAIAFLDKVSDQYGKCSYQPAPPEGIASKTHTMTSVGMLCRLFTGSPPTDPRVIGGADYLMKSVPVWGENGSGVNMYYWYYGTLTVFQVGGEAWKKWNPAVRGALCDNQRRGGDEDGSWDPVCVWGTSGGRVYATAVGALTLEVYYRYLPMYRD